MYCVAIREGLGNQMFQYAFAKALEKKTGGKVYLETEKRYENILLDKSYFSRVKREYQLDVFKISLPVADKEKADNWSYLEKTNGFPYISGLVNNLVFRKKVVCDKSPFSYRPELLSLKGDVFYLGWFQNYSYFAGIRKTLLKEFKLREKISLPHELYNLLKTGETVSVHIRRTDYKELGQALNVRYYTKAFEYIKEHVDNPRVLVFSDDVPWVKENVPIPFDTYYISGNRFEDYEELMIMSYCKHNIIANSTFSWWGAWLNRNKEKIVIAPRIWTKQEEKGLIPDSWISIW